MPATTAPSPARTAPAAADPRRVPGVAWAVVADGRVHTGATGTRSLATGAPMTATTAALWFSMTKIATATAAMGLADAGTLDLHAPVDTIVPGVLPRAARPLVRVEHLLAHTSGLPNPVPVRWVRSAAEPAPDADAFLRARLARVRRLRFAPGTRAAYSNLNYLLLGEVMAAAGGVPFPELLHDVLLAPLCMHHTGWALPDDAPSAIGHQRLPRGAGVLLRAALPRGIVGARTGSFVSFRPFLVDGAAYGGLVGPVADAARLLALHAAGGVADGRTLLSPATIARMQAITHPGRRFDHGLGWFRTHAERGRRPAVVEHYGSGGGYFNLMRLVPERGAGVVVMGNSTGWEASACADELLAPWIGGRSDP